MYRKRAARAHQLHHAAAPAPGPAQEQQQPTGPGMQFYNPAEYQNGEPAQQNGVPADQASNGASGLADWHNHNQTGTDQNQNHNQFNYKQQQEAAQNNQQQQLQQDTQQYHQQESGALQYQQQEYNQQEQQETGQYSQQYQQEMGQYQQQETQETVQYQQQQVSPELHLDPSGQWYWDFAQQQWAPYYQQQSEEPAAVQELVQELDQLALHGAEQEVQQSSQEATSYPAQSQPDLETQLFNGVEENQQQDNHYHQQNGDYGLLAAAAAQVVQQQQVVEAVGDSPEMVEELLQAPPTAPPVNQEPLIEFSPAAAPAPQLEPAPAPLPAGVEQPAPIQQLDFAPPPAIVQPEPAPAAALEPQPAPPPLGPPDLVDHRPGASQPELVSDLASAAVHPPDLTGGHGAAPLPARAHDQHYDFYSQAFKSPAEAGPVRLPGPVAGMPDVTGGPSPAPLPVQPPVGPAKAGPDILRTEPGGGAVGGAVVPSSDRNLFMETGELLEEDAVLLGGGGGAGGRAAPLPAPPALPPMVGGNEQPAGRLVVGEHQPVVNREVEGESAPTPAPAALPLPPAPAPVQLLPRGPIEGESEPPAARVVTVAPRPAPTLPAAPAPQQAPGEVRSEAAGSDRRDDRMMGGPAGRAAPPLPTPGRDIAGEEAGPEYSRPGRGGGRGSPLDSEEGESDSGEGAGRFPLTGRPQRSYRSSTDREEGDRRYGSGRRDRRGERGPGQHQSYYEDRQRRQREEEERRSSHRDYRDRDYRDYRDYREQRDYRERREYQERRMKREPREFSHSHYDDYEERDDRSSHRPSRPSSRAGSISFHDMSNMSMSSQQQWAAMQQAMLQEQYRQQQMMMMNPLQYQLQTAVAEMEKALEQPKNVGIYKQHWDHYSRIAGGLEKLSRENPVQHHLLRHFKENFWHLVERQQEAEAAVKQEIAAATVPSPEQSLQEESRANNFSENFSSELSSILPAGGARGGAAELATPSPAPDRLTPLMFSRPHACARLSATGLLVRVEGSYRAATVELHSLAELLGNSAASQQLLAFPGPLRPGTTHKNDVIRFCERKVAAARSRRDLADKESYCLLWDLLILLLRQKGQVEGSDLAELLLRDCEPGAGQGGEESSASSVTSSGRDRARQVVGPGPEAVDRFRTYLLHGNKTEGLEYAMRVGLWGHALFLASKMDGRTYAGVMTRFANGLAATDPLQTLYQLMSARVPSAMKQCGEARWGDWRPHLAMILSNNQGGETNIRSIITLGDTLLAKGQLFAAQFCYIVSSVEWGQFGNPCAKLVLLLSSMSEQSLEQFATTEAIQCTEIYEFVQRLASKEYELPHLQPYKYLHMVRLLEAGHSHRAQDYSRALAEQIAESVAAGRELDRSTVPHWVHHTLHLATKLKYLDPVYTTSQGELGEIPDPEWLDRLQAAVTSLDTADWYRQQGGELPQEGEREVVSSQQEEVAGQYQQDQQEYSQQYEQPGYSQQYDPSQYQQPAQYSQEQYGQPEPEQASGGQSPVPAPVTSPLGFAPAPVTSPPGDPVTSPLGFTPAPVTSPPGDPVTSPLGFTPAPVASPVADPAPLPGPVASQTEQPTQPTFVNPSELPAVTSPFMFDPAAMAGPPGLPAIPEQGGGVGRKDSWQSGGAGSPPSLSRQGSLGPPRSRQVSESGDYYGSLSPPAPAPVMPPAPAPSPAKPVEKPAKTVGLEGEKKPAKKSSWLPSWLTRKNDQAILPDDTNKSIVFDEAKGRWVNQDEPEEEAAAAAPPPMDPAFQAAGPAAGPAVPPAVPPSFRAGLTGRKSRYVATPGMSKPAAAPAGIPNGGPPAMLSPGPPAAAVATAGPASLPPMMFNPGNMAGPGPEQPPGF